MKKTYLFLLLICFVLFLTRVKSKEKTMCIFIDAGHGGFDGGACYSLVSEKNITLQMAYRLESYYENLGIKVYMTRYSDLSLGQNKKEDLKKRVELINQSSCMFFLSLHLNAYPMTSLYGAQTFYNEYNAESRKLALLIQNSLTTIMGNTLRKAKKIEGKYLMDNVDKTGALVELGFLSNDNERGLLQNSDYQDKMAYAIYLGTIEYLSYLE